LRADDDKEFGDVSDALQSAVVSINQHIDEAKGQMQAVQQLQQQPAANTDEMKESLQNCSNALDFFTTSNSPAG